MKLDFNDCLDLYDRWVELNEAKNAYQFAKESFDQTQFTQLVKDTFQYISQFKSDYWDFSNHISEIEGGLFNFADILVELANYVGGCSSCDESDQFVFTASQSIVRLLLNWARSSCREMPTDETGILYGDNELCGIYPRSIEDCNSKYWMQVFEYDTNVGDMSKFIELAKRSHE